MRETNRCYHNLEWPPEGASLSGPVVWLRGWAVGKPGEACLDVRVQHLGIHLGIMGLPRTDLAAHFGSDRAWLPAEFIIGVPVADGPATLCIEVMDAFGGWHELQTITLTVAPDGQPPPRIEGRLETHATGTWTVRDAHHPFHGHLDDPGAAPVLRHGRAPVFGWLLDESRGLAAVLATTDTLVFNHLEHSITDEALAAKVPQFPAARHARLRGAVDFPATLLQPVCLRVYAVSTDGTVTLCFAQRLRPATTRRTRATAGAAYVTIPAGTLPDLPSGRPRRLLIVLRALLPADATLRALDIVQHLTAARGWAIRGVATEDGPLRSEFEQAGAEILITNPAPLFTAKDPGAMMTALATLERHIRWDHLDAIAIFDPLCGWALTLAERRQIPTLFDCSDDEPFAPDPTAIPEVQALLRTGWRSATGLCFSSVAAAKAQADILGNRPAEIIPLWHSPHLTDGPAQADPPVALVPLRTADWLRRHHPAVAARWQFRQGSGMETAAARLSRLDEDFNQSGLQSAGDWTASSLTLCLGPLFGRGPIRPVLDALAGGIPAIAARRPLTEEILGSTRLPLVHEANPLALAHALLARDADPEYLRRETATAAELIRTRHDPDRLLPRWAALLNRIAAQQG